MIGWNAAAKGKSLADKVWDDHLVVKGAAGTPDLPFIDLHFPITAEADRAFTVRRSGDEWGYAYGDTGTETPEILSERAGQEKLITELASFIAYFPGME